MACGDLMPFILRPLSNLRLPDPTFPFAFSSFDDDLNKAAVAEKLNVLAPK
jgi:hypothetical protein